MDAETVRVCTYNVRRDVDEDGRFAWDGRREAVASTLRFHRPDVVGLQEPLGEQYDDLRESLPAYEWVGRPRYGGEEGEYCPVGYRAGRFERVAGDTFWLSETPDEAGRVGWDATYPRIATWVRLRDRRTAEALTYCNTHLDHEGPRARVEAARLLVERVGDLREGGSAVVAGDCNATPDEEPYRVLAGEGGNESPLADARTASPHPPHGPATTRTDYESLRPDRRIDHVFVVDCGVAHYGVAADVAPDGSYPSDHLPVVVDLTV
ncbi:endonuclease [Halobacteriales archaeon QH_7_68_42]|nr:MAG: endonuclease [Halobacteriales archaeon QH_7_68_42]